MPELPTHLPTISSESSWKARLVLIACLLTGAVLCAVHEKLQLSKHIVLAPVLTAEFWKEIGIALLVAGIIGLVVELVIRKEEARERVKLFQEQKEKHENDLKLIKENVFAAMFGVFMPYWIGSELRRVFDTKMMRSNWTLSYRFLSLPPNEELKWRSSHGPLTSDDLLTVIVTVKYKVVNLSDRALPLKIEHTMEPTLPLDCKHSTFLSLEVRREGEPILSWTCDTQDGRVVQSIPKPYLRILELKDNTLMIESEKAVDVIYMFKSVRRRCDHDVWMTPLPADGLHLTTEIVNTPEDNLSDLDFYFEASHPEPRTAEQSLAAINQRNWHVRSGLLPYQGFILHWFREDPNIPSCPERIVKPQSPEPSAISPQTLEAGRSAPPAV
jgi:hypothetical protein